MRTIGKTVTVAAMAVALLVAGAIAFGPTADGPAGDLGTSVSNRSSSALLAPVVSAGSSHVGASVTCTAHVSWPSGAAGAGVGANVTRSNSAATRPDRVMEASSASRTRS